MTRTGERKGLKAALLTPPGEGGISVIALSGPGAAALVRARLLSPRRRTRGGGGRLVYGLFRDASGAVLDEVIIACASADYVEINCHGGALPTRRVLRSLEAAGAAVEHRRFPPSVTGAENAVEREALEALFSASTELAARVFAAQAGGALTKALGEIAAGLHGPSPNRTDPAAALAVLQESAALGLALATPAAIAVVGPSNAGKSTIVNALAGFERNIVSEVAGTTRDAVRVPAALAGVPVVLVDTAGAGGARGALAAEAESRAARAFQEADVALVVIDASAVLPGGHGPPVGAKAAVIAANKVDLGRNDETFSTAAEWDVPIVETSALAGVGLPELENALLAAMGLTPPDSDVAAGPVVFTRRQLECILGATEALRAGRPQDARGLLDGCIDGARA